MKTTQTLITDIELLAQLLGRMDRGGQHPDAAQYRLVAQRLIAELGRVADAESIDAVLQANPAAAELYENLNYQHAGLCRSRLEVALSSELRAREAIARAMRPTSAHGA